MRAALVGPRRRYRPGQLDGARQLSMVARVDDAHPEPPASTRATECGDVAGGVDDRTTNPGHGERAEGPLCRPPLHIAGRVCTCRHRPGIEPAQRRRPGRLATLQHLGDLSRGLSKGDLTSAQPAHRAVLFPGAEDRVGPLQHRPGPSDPDIELAALDGSLAVEVDGHHGAHGFHAVVGTPDVARRSDRLARRQAKPSCDRADCSDLSKPALV